MHDDRWPKFMTAGDLAGSVFPVSQAVILQQARKHGLGRKMGRAVIFSPEDCQQLYEALSGCHSSSFNVVTTNRRSGSSEGPSAAAALTKARALLKGKSRKKSAPSVRPSCSQKPSTVVELPLRSRKLS
ncbi:MAG: hypothetical protein FWD12_13180 [Alphaproteobacteria bacterium]|nr:hypothetical protein [Alphaproteobacteria bacterium]